MPVKGQLELFEDSFTLRFAPGLGKARVAMGDGETVPFSHIANLNGVTRTRLLAKRTEIEVGTTIGVTWEITGNQRLFTSLQSAYQAWRGKSPK